MSLLTRVPSRSTEDTSAPRRPRRKARITAVVAASALALAVGAAAVEAQLARGDLRDHPAPGQLVTIGDELLHVQCSGAGPVTVVLESGVVDPAVLFDTMRDRLASSARVCAYDRPGHGWAGPPAGPQDPFTQADTVAAAFDGPLVIVAHSLGGGVARALAHRHPGRVAGLILLDPTNTETLASVPRWLLSLAGGWQLRVGELAGRLGVLRAFDHEIGARFLPDAVPEEALDRSRHHLRPAVLVAARGELAAHRARADDLDALLTPGALGEVPVTVVSAATSSEADRSFHARLAQLSDVGRHVVAPRGGHHVHLDTPDLVADEITALLPAG